jgi:hypothetical protein
VTKVGLELIDGDLAALGSVIRGRRSGDRGIFMKRYWEHRRKGGTMTMREFAGRKE